MYICSTSFMEYICLSYNLFNLFKARFKRKKTFKIQTTMAWFLFLLSNLILFNLMVAKISWKSLTSKENVQVLLYFTWHFVKCNIGPNPLSSEKYDAAARTVKAAAGCQLRGEKVCLVGVSFRERSTISLSRARCLFLLFGQTRVLSSHPPSPSPPLTPPHLFLRGYTFEGKNRLWSWMKIWRCLAPTRFTEWRKMSIR